MQSTRVCAVFSRSGGVLAFQAFERAQPSQAFSTSQVLGFGKIFNNFLLPFWNRFDSDRVEEIGAEKAAAEWLLKNGASVRWSGTDRRIHEYGFVGMAPDHVVIEEISADNASITASGFKYLSGLKGVKEVRFRNCDYVNDACLARLSPLSPTLNALSLESCHRITGPGIADLRKLRNLRSLSLKNLKGVTRKEEVMRNLQKELKHCAIQWET